MQSAYRFSPFSKPLQEFPSEELASLRDVAEGWFVDYKEATLPPKDFGKHLSAFANQYGGWLFVGIKEGREGTDKSLKAESFSGIPSSDVSKVLGHLRDAAVAHISPTIYYETRVIDGPVEKIGLEAGRSIVVIGIPEGSNPPYVHSSGRIYRRVADASDPKPETDRAVLDQMWRKAEQGVVRLQKFILDPTQRSPLDRVTMCHVYLMEDLTFSNPDYSLTLSQFSDCMRPRPDEPFGIILDHVHATQDGFAARLLGPNNPLSELPTLRWWRNGNALLSIPVGKLPIPSLPSAVADEIYRDFLGVMGGHRKTYRSVLNMNQWLLLLLAISGRYARLRESLNASRTVYGKVVFSNARLCTPFLSMRSYLEFVNHFGIPVCQDDMTMFPQGTSLDSFLVLDLSSNPSIEIFGALLNGGLRGLGVDLVFAEIAATTLSADLQGALRQGLKRT